MFLILPNDLVQWARGKDCDRSEKARRVLSWNALFAFAILQLCDSAARSFPVEAQCSSQVTTGPCAWQVRCDDHSGPCRARVSRHVVRGSPDPAPAPDRRSPIRVASHGNSTRGETWRSGAVARSGDRPQLLPNGSQQSLLCRSQLTCPASIPLAYCDSITESSTRST